MSQNDYTIDNDTGQNVRLDIEAAFQALASQNAGAGEPTTTYSYMLWADTANDMMKVRNAANSAWLEVYVLSTGVPASGAGGTNLTVDNLTTDGGTLVINTIWFADSSAGALSVTLPDTSLLGLDPGEYAEVHIVDDKGTAGTNNITINRDGTNLIMGDTTLVVNSNYARIKLIYTEGTSAWRLSV